jgi:hypothetical protein
MSKKLNSVESESEIDEVIKVVDDENEVMIEDECFDDDDADDDDEINHDDHIDESLSSYRDPPEGHIHLRPSNFRILPPTVFFEYPPELNIQRKDIGYIEPLGNTRSLVYGCHWERNCIKNAFKRAGKVLVKKYIVS